MGVGVGQSILLTFSVYFVVHCFTLHSMKKEIYAELKFA